MTMGRRGSRDRRSLKQTRPSHERDPIVYDLRGVPVGVRLTARAAADDETPAARHLARVTALRKTRELEGREWISLGVF
jgi:hypothetical protein